MPTTPILSPNFHTSFLSLPAPGGPGQTPLPILYFPQTLCLVRSARTSRQAPFQINLSPPAHAPAGSKPVRYQGPTLCMPSHIIPAGNSVFLVDPGAIVLWHCRYPLVKNVAESQFCAINACAKCYEATCKRVLPTIRKTTKVTCRPNWLILLPDKDWSKFVG